MYINDKELALKQILNNIKLLEEKISDIIMSYYIEKHFVINGITVKMSIYDLVQKIKYDYNNVVLEDFYKEFD